MTDRTMEALKDIIDVTLRANGRREDVNFLNTLLLKAGDVARAALTPSPPAQEGFDFLAHLARQREWSGNTFGPGPRTAGVIDHIRKELREIEADPSDISEWIDVVILALDGAWRAGFQPQEIIDALVAKQNKNEARQWPDWRTASPDKAIEHVRGRTEHSEIMKEIMGESYDELD